MKTISKVYVGVDVSKDNLDVYIYPTNKAFKVANSKVGIKKMIEMISEYDVENTGCEATGGYEKLLANTFKKNGYSVWIIDPRRVKGFIVASGCKGKTDKIDAQKIAEFVARTPQGYDPIGKTELQENLQSLINRRLDIVKFLSAEKTRLKHPIHQASASSIKKFIKCLEKEIKAIDQQAKNLIESDNALNANLKILTSIQGIGNKSAVIFLATLPELGKVKNSQIASLTGLCPYDNQSGNRRGKQSIYGGRMMPRNALYMCALTTIKYDLLFKSFYDRLIEKGKPFKVAIVAVMRKLIALANTLIAEQRPCRESLAV